MDRVREALDRCEREIAEIDARDPNGAEHRAYLGVLGREDWRHEKRLIERAEDTASSPATSEMPEVALTRSWIIDRSNCATAASIADSPQVQQSPGGAK
jgi:hypothetical protein